MIGVIESERGLSEERKAYLEQRITESFPYYPYELRDHDLTFDEIQKFLEDEARRSSKKNAAKYPDGASKEDVLADYLSSLHHFLSTEQVFELALLWGERFGAGEFDSEVRVTNLINNTKF